MRAQFLRGSTVRTEDYRQLSNRFAQLAIESTAPTLAQSLMAIALDYASRATNAPKGEQWNDQLAEFGD
jgi:hypothetical protein